MLKAELKILSVFWFLVMVCYAQAENNKKIDSSVICRNKKEVRTLRTERSEDGKCNAIYTKLGKDQNVGLASNQASCAEILRKVRVNLEAADWKCREVKESRVSNLIEM